MSPTIKYLEFNIIKDFKILLKDIEPFIRKPEFLINGRDLPNFSLRPREIVANWLLCVVLRKLHGESITFGEDSVGDGLIIDLETGSVVHTEHVSALENTHNPQPKGEERIIRAIDHKIEKGKKYAGKLLVVFFDGAGEFYRNKIRENIKGRHNFKAVFCIGLLTSDEKGYSYSVTEFSDSIGDRSITFKVDINHDFNDWNITQI